MGVSLSVIIRESIRTMQEPLRALGFEINPTPPSIVGSEFIFWFVKQPESQADMYRILEFQAIGFSKNNLFDLAINLHRRINLNYLGDDYEIGPAQIWAVRLAPCMWETQMKDKMLDYWWHFTSVEELRTAYFDILEKVVKFGIPFLDDPDSDWYSGTGGLVKRPSINH